MDTSVNIDVSSIQRLTFGDSCFVPTGLCVEEHIFIDTLFLDDFAPGYYASMELYARNNTVENIVAPGSTGMTFYAEIADPAIGQNSIPDFGFYPPGAYFCIGVEKELSLNVTDEDGDSLVFSLVDPLNSFGSIGGAQTNPGPYNPIAWDVGAGFDLSNILGAAGSMVIDSTTGIITATAVTSGIFVFAVKVEEYRNGVKIGESRRDIQYAAFNCVFDAPPFVLGEVDTIRLFADEPFCHDIILAEQDAGDTVLMVANLEPGFDGTGAYLTHDPNNTYYYFDPVSGLTIPLVTNDPQIDTNFNMYVDITNVARRFCWKPGCEHIEVTQPFELTYTAFSIGCGGTSDTLTGSIIFEVGPRTEGWEILPNVFTPNGDGVNDELYIEGIPDVCFDHMDVKVFNRWGQIVYESTEPQFRWDGTSNNGNPCPSGTYFIMLNGVYGGSAINNDFIGYPSKEPWQKFTVTLFRD